MTSSNAEAPCGVGAETGHVAPEASEPAVLSASSPPTWPHAAWTSPTWTWWFKRDLHRLVPSSNMSLPLGIESEASLVVENSLRAAGVRPPLGEVDHCSRHSEQAFRGSTQLGHGRWGQPWDPENHNPPPPCSPRTSPRLGLEDLDMYVHRAGRTARAGAV